MEGQIEVEGRQLDKDDAISGSVDELTHLKFKENGMVVLFLADLEAPMTYKGNFSGMRKEGDL